MGNSKTRIGGLFVLAGLLAVASVEAFGLPLGTLLIIGLLLCCPLLMLGMHGGSHHHGGRSPATGAPEAGQATGPVDGH